MSTDLKLFIALSIVANSVLCFTAGSLWQRSKTRRAVVDATNDLKASNDALAQAVDNNKQQKGQ